ncbi:branched-chain amino acid ABC transporter permease [Streptomyces longwoodensis]|jgi:branched-chain amino acid transport system permease protein|uniref:Branched-chain amino acid ABC transporter permease n=1 Tax=Streptomyces lasalocidi TaxID=324833 RepID=A0A4U5WQS8_STRLS|nr:MULTISPECIES: branched-chain amino acid ABC transporter permease [Streptomyces]MCX4997532.1 branched-chain amino acid ABC transporter permease [Streptomyces longwoodensis]TKT04360.1 branched-chain amino acid ABC transporter permease [Streptomyces lasalocidi]WRY92149.1 branched-chain amino acid ABC transporter permease [Streptomyces longwoodensis]WTI43574.1 branched-chain amino acid ABC transporter permease [Streptomyces longwoodensis]WUC56331.1 branched-chain amino acid ABC transporter perm
MTAFLDNTLSGLALGAVYALVALGFVVIFKASGVLNFAQGSLLLFGGYLVAVLHDDLGFAGALAVAVLATGVLAGAVDRLLLQRGGPDQAAAPVQTIVTIGIDIVLVTELSRRIGGDLLSLGDPWGDAVTEVGPVTVADSRIAAIAVSAVVIGAVFALFRFTPWGLSLRAAAEDTEAAALMGVRLSRVRMLAWCLAGALAALAAVFLAAFPAPGLERTTGQIALKAFPAAILGGMASPAGALAGSLVIGLTEAFVAGYQSDLHVLGEGVGDVAPYAVMIAVLLVRPTGLFGAKGAVRV